MQGSRWELIVLSGQSAPSGTFWGSACPDGQAAGTVGTPPGSCSPGEMGQTAPLNPPLTPRTQAGGGAPCTARPPVVLPAGACASRARGRLGLPWGPGRSVFSGLEVTWGPGGRPGTRAHGKCSRQTPQRWGVGFVTQRAPEWGRSAWSAPRHCPSVCLQPLSCLGTAEGAGTP